MKSIDYLIKGHTLSKKDSFLLLTALSAARRQEQQMLYFAECATFNGAVGEEFAELIGSAVISRGIPAWLSGMEVLERIATSPERIQREAPSFHTVEQCIDYYEKEFEVTPTWVKHFIAYLPDTLTKYSNLRTTVLQDGVVSRLLKELLLYAINICDDYEKGTVLHKRNALLFGATNEQLQEVRTLCIVAVGIHVYWNDGEEMT